MIDTIGPPIEQTALEHLATDLWRLTERAGPPKGRIMLCRSSGTGKSTIAPALCDEVGDGSVSIVQLNGFDLASARHRADRVLDVASPAPGASAASA